MIAKTPSPPYYAVIFTSTITSENQDYAAMADAMVKLAQRQDGFLGIESENAQHSIAQEKGRSEWYQTFKTRIAKVERDYNFEKE